MIKLLDYDETHVEFKKSIEKLIEKEVTPNYADWEKHGLVDRRIWNKMGELGMLCPHVSEKWGGFGDFTYNVVANETLCENGATSLAVGLAIHSDIVATYIEKYGTKEQKAKYLSKMVTGEIVAALGMTEPNAGSDLGAIKTSSFDFEKSLIVNGQKVFITNGWHADVVLTAVRTDGEGYGGVSLVLIDTNSSTREHFDKKLLNKIGLKSQDTCELFFNDLVVPQKNILGERGKGFFMMMDELPRERLSLSIGALASTRSILTETINYVKSRTAFGKEISKFQNTQFKIAEMDSLLCAAESYGRWCLDCELKGTLTTEEASKLKVVSTDLQCDIVDQCLQLHGGYGYMSEYNVARAFCDGRVQKIYGGTNEIMKVLISRDLLK
jgi:acyl-CoA dehydrogenase